MLKYLILMIAFCSGGYANASGDFGLGLMIGGPTGITANYKLQDDRSIDAAFGAGMGSRDLHVHSTYLVHFLNSINLDNYDFGWYIGGGARFATRDDDDDDETLFGPRGSAGLNFPIKGSNGGNSYIFDAFVEFAMIINIVSDVDVDGEFGLGGRYYF